VRRSSDFLSEKIDRKKRMRNPAHGANLRRGRFSQAGQIYLLTLVSAGRSRIFEDLFAARHVVRVMHVPAVVAVAETLAFVVMPDHVHWLVQLKEGMSLGEAVRRLKAGVSLALGRPVWQRGFHDHALRRDEDIVTAARYVVANPLRAGLVRRIGDYAHWDAVWLGNDG
jgi:REP element-mobilizing transposase RayT